MKLIIKETLCALLVFSLMLFTFSLTFVKVNALEKTITINYDDDFSPSFPTSDGNAEDTLHTVNDFSFMEKGIYKGTSAKYLMFVQNKGFLYNTESLGTINSIAITYSSGTSTTAKIGVYFGTIQVSTYTTTSNETIAGQSKTDTFTNTTSGNGYFQISTSNKNCQITKIVIKYEEAIEGPLVAIDNQISTLMVNESHQFTTQLANIEGTVEWDSLDETVATINEDGVLTAIKEGTTVVTANIGAVVSNSVNVKVYPSNTSPISIEKAIALGLEAGENTTPYKYSVIGTVKTVDGSNFIITDGDNDINVYKPSHGKEVGDKLLVNGTLETYSSIPQFKSDSTLKNLYTVTYILDNGEDNQVLNDVVEGTLLNTPLSPVKEGFTFTKWMNGANEWNFELDEVNSDLTLVADWLNNSLISFKNSLNLINTYISLAYRYNISGDITSDELNASKFAATSTSYKDFSNVTINSTIYSGNTAKTASGSIQLRSTSYAGIVTTSSLQNARSIVVEWDDSSTAGRTIDIYGKNEPYTAASDLYNVDIDIKGDKIGSLSKGETTLNISGDYQYIGIRSNSGALFLKSITINWGNMTYDSDFRIRAAYDSELDTLATFNDATDYGIEISTGIKTVKYSYNNELLYTDIIGENNIKYVIIDLGDALTNSERLDDVFTIKAYAIIDSKTYYSEITKEMSIVDLVKTYHDNLSYKDLVQDMYDLLQNIGKIS